VTPPSGYDASSPEALFFARYMRYPLHVNHLRAIVEAGRTSTTLPESERRFIDLLDAWVAMCDGTFTPAEYRSQIARTAADAVTLEDDDSDDSGTPTNFAPRVPGGWPGTDPTPTSPFGGLDTATAPVGLTMDFNYHMAGLADNPALNLPISSSMPVMAGYLPAWATPILTTVEGWRAWFRLALVAMIFAVLFYRIISSLWMEV
jgi:hypothetical protein